MKKSLSKKLSIFLLVIILIIVLTVILYKVTNSSQNQDENYQNQEEFKKYIEITDTSSLEGFEMTVIDNKVIYSKESKLDEYIGNVKLIRAETNNLYMSNNFETQICKITDEDIENTVNKFVNTCQKYVNCEDVTVSINIESSQDQKIGEDNSILGSLKNDLKVHYVFDKENKLYMVSIYKQNDNVIGDFSYNGIIPEVKTPDELTEEEKKKATEKFETIPVEGENGVG